MASKKETKKDDTKKEDAVNDFDLIKALTKLELHDMFKAGLNYYIESNELQIASQKDFDKIFKEYGELQL